MTEKMTGGCQCGAVRYGAEIENDDAYLCHCRMCQRATGGVSIAFKNVRQAQVTWTGERAEHASSPFGLRGFCAACGTPLSFRYVDSRNIDLTIGSFDDPYRFTPTSHFGAESRHEKWLDTHGLPATRSDEYEPLVQRWKQTGGEPD